MDNAILAGITVATVLGTYFLYKLVTTLKNVLELADDLNQPDWVWTETPAEGPVDLPHLRLSTRLD